MGIRDHVVHHWAQSVSNLSATSRPERHLDWPRLNLHQQEALQRARVIRNVHRIFSEHGHGHNLQDGLVGGRQNDRCRNAIALDE